MTEAQNYDQIMSAAQAARWRQAYEEAVDLYRQAQETTAEGSPEWQAAAERYEQTQMLAAIVAGVGWQKYVDWPEMADEHLLSLLPRLHAARQFLPATRADGAMVDILKEEQAWIEEAFNRGLFETKLRADRLGKEQKWRQAAPFLQVLLAVDPTSKGTQTGLRLAQQAYQEEERLEQLLAEGDRAVLSNLKEAALKYSLAQSLAARPDLPLMYRRAEVDLRKQLADQAQTIETEISRAERALSSQDTSGVLDTLLFLEGRLSDLESAAQVNNLTLYTTRITQFQERMQALKQQAWAVQDITDLKERANDAFSRDDFELAGSFYQAAADRGDADAARSVTTIQHFVRRVNQQDATVRQIWQDKGLAAARAAFDTGMLDEWPSNPKLRSLFYSLYMESGTQALSQAQYREAFDYFQQVATRFPEDAAAQRWGDTARDSRELAQLQESASKAIDQTGADLQAYATANETLKIALGRLLAGEEQGRDYGELAIAIRAASAQVADGLDRMREAQKLTGLAADAARRGWLNKAERQYREALDNWPEHAPALAGLNEIENKQRFITERLIAPARNARDQGDPSGYAKACANLEDALEGWQDEAEIKTLYVAIILDWGRSLLDSGDEEEALRCVNQARPYATPAEQRAIDQFSKRVHVLPRLSAAYSSAQKELQTVQNNPDASVGTLDSALQLLTDLQTEAEEVPDWKEQFQTLRAQIVRRRELQKKLDSLREDSRKALEQGQWETGLQQYRALQAQLQAMGLPDRRTATNISDLEAQWQQIQTQLHGGQAALEQARTAALTMDEAAANGALQEARQAFTVAQTGVSYPVPAAKEGLGTAEQIELELNARMRLHRGRERLEKSQRLYEAARSAYAGRDFNGASQSLQQAVNELSQVDATQIPEGAETRQQIEDLRQLVGLLQEANATQNVDRMGQLLALLESRPGKDRILIDALSQLRERYLQKQQGESEKAFKEAENHRRFGYYDQAQAAITRYLSLQPGDFDGLKLQQELIREQAVMFSVRASLEDAHKNIEENEHLAPVVRQMMDMLRRLRSILPPTIGSELESGLLNATIVTGIPDETNQEAIKQAVQDLNQAVDKLTAKLSQQISEVGTRLELTLEIIEQYRQIRLLQIQYGARDTAVELGEWRRAFDIQRDITGQVPVPLLIQFHDWVDRKSIDYSKRLREAMFEGRYDDARRTIQEAWDPYPTWVKAPAEAASARKPPPAHLLRDFPDDDPIWKTYYEGHEESSSIPKELFEQVCRETTLKLEIVGRLKQELTEALQQSADATGRVAAERKLTYIANEAEAEQLLPFSKEVSRHLVRLQTDIKYDAEQRVRRLIAGATGILQTAQTTSDCEGAIQMLQEALPLALVDESLNQTVQGWLSSATLERDGRRALELVPPDYQSATSFLARAHADRPGAAHWFQLEQLARQANEIAMRQQKQEGLLQQVITNYDLQKYEDALSALNQLTGDRTNKGLVTWRDLILANLSLDRARAAFRQPHQFDLARQQLADAESLLQDIPPDAPIETKLSRLSTEVSHFRREIEKAETETINLRASLQKAVEKAQSGGYSDALQQIESIPDYSKHIEATNLIPLIRRERDDLDRARNHLKRAELAEAKEILNSLRKANLFCPGEVSSLEGKVALAEEMQSRKNRIEFEIKRGNFDKAEDELDQMLTQALSAEWSQEVNNLHDQIDQARQQVAGWQKVFQQGINELDVLRFEQAEALLQEAAKTAPTKAQREKAEESLTELGNKRRIAEQHKELVDRGSRAMQEGSYDEAMLLFNQVWESDLLTESRRKVSLKRKEAVDAWVHSLLQEAETIFNTHSPDAYTKVEALVNQVLHLEPRASLQDRQRAAEMRQQALIQRVESALTEAAQAIEAASTPEECDIAIALLDKLPQQGEQVPTQLQQKRKLLENQVEVRKRQLDEEEKQREWLRQIEMGETHLEHGDFERTIDIGQRVMDAISQSAFPSAPLTQRVLRMITEARKQQEAIVQQKKEAELTKLHAQAQATYDSATNNRMHEVERAIEILANALQLDPERSSPLSRELETKQRDWSLELSLFEETNRTRRLAIEHLKSYEFEPARQLLLQLPQVAPRLQEQMNALLILTEHLELAVSLFRQKERDYEANIAAYEAAAGAARTLDPKLLRELEIEDRAEQLRLEWRQTLLADARQMLQEGNLAQAQDRLVLLKEKLAVGERKEYRDLEQQLAYKQAVQQAEELLAHLPEGAAAALSQLEIARSFSPAGLLNADKALGHLAQSMLCLQQRDLLQARQKFNRAIANLSANTPYVQQAKHLLEQAEGAEIEIRQILQQADAAWISPGNYDLVVATILKARRLDTQSPLVQEYAVRARQELERQIRRTGWSEITAYESDLHLVNLMLLLVDDADQLPYKNLADELKSERDRLIATARQTATEQLDLTPELALKTLDRALNLDPENSELQVLADRSRNRQKVLEQIRERLAQANSHAAQSLEQAIQDVYAAQSLDNNHPDVVSQAEIILDLVETRINSELGEGALNSKEYEKLGDLQRLAQGVAVNLQQTDLALREKDKPGLRRAEDRTIAWRKQIQNHRNQHLSAAASVFQRFLAVEDLAQMELALTRMKSISPRDNRVTMAERQYQEKESLQQALTEKMERGWQLVNEGAYSAARPHFEQALQAANAHPSPALWISYCQLMSSGIQVLVDSQVQPYGEVVTKFQNALKLVSSDRPSSRLWGERQIEQFAVAREQAAAWLAQAKQMQRLYQEYDRHKDVAHTKKQAIEALRELRRLQQKAPEYDTAAKTELDKVWSDRSGLVASVASETMQPPLREESMATPIMDETATPDIPESGADDVTAVVEDTGIQTDKNKQLSTRETTSEFSDDSSLDYSARTAGEDGEEVDDEATRVADNLPAAEFGSQGEWPVQEAEIDSGDGEVATEGMAESGEKAGVNEEEAASEITRGVQEEFVEGSAPSAADAQNLETAQHVSPKTDELPDLMTAPVQQIQSGDNDTIPGRREPASEGESLPPKEQAEQVEDKEQAFVEDQGAGGVNTRQKPSDLKDPITNRTANDEDDIWKNFTWIELPDDNLS